jgi:hypothetical protein
MGAATIENLAFGVRSWRESHEVGCRGCLSTVGITNSGTHLLENRSEMFRANRRSSAGADKREWRTALKIFREPGHSTKAIFFWKCFFFIPRVP